MHTPKADYPLSEIRRFLEPGPILLVGSAWKGSRNVMAMGWHMMLGFSPALFACYIWEGNHSYEMLRRSKECTINLPTVSMMDQVVGIGNSSGRSEDKFEKFGLSTSAATHVDAPLIDECHANFECRLVDERQIAEYGLFIWEVVKAHVRIEPDLPRTMHYLGRGEFMTSGAIVSRRDEFRPGNL